MDHLALPAPKNEDRSSRVGVEQVGGASVGLRDEGAGQNSSRPPTWPMGKMWRVAAQMVSSVWIGVPSVE